jgi:CBS domain-containing protein
MAVKRHLILCSDVMNKVERCFIDDPVADVAGRMRARRVGFMPVCDAHGRIVGTITDRDLTTRVLADRLSPDVPVLAVMSTGPITCRPADPLEAAEQLMEHYFKWRVVCVDARDRPVGVISLSDIADAEQGWRAAKLLREVSSRDVRVF